MIKYKYQREIFLTVLNKTFLTYKYKLLQYYIDQESSRKLSINKKNKRKNKNRKKIIKFLLNTFIFFSKSLNQSIVISYAFLYKFFEKKTK